MQYRSTTREGVQNDTRTVRIYEGLLSKRNKLQNYSSFIQNVEQIMKDIILGGIFGAVIVFFVAVVYGFRVGVL
jgi:uncharacterized membrane protein